MRIKKITIYGFGKWVDAEWVLPDDGLVVLAGNNESGKSTLHRFILFILFGFPPRERKQYQPKDSSKIGGRLQIYDEEIGLFTIERIGDKQQGQAVCYLPDGETADENWLQTYLQGLDKNTYEAIFFFSSLELSEITAMDETDLGEILLGIGMSGAGNISQIEKRLETRLGDIFKKTGKIPALNQQLTKLDTLMNQLVAHQAEAATYNEKTEKLNELENNLTNVEQRIEELERSRNNALKQQTALPFIQEYQHLQENKPTDDRSIEFPNSGLERYEKIKEKLQPLQSHHAVLNKQKERIDLKQAELQTVLLSVEKQIAFKKVQTELELFIQREQEKDHLQAKIEITNEEITAEVEQLQLLPHMEQLEENSLPFYVEESWKQLKEEKAEMTLSKQAIEAERESLQEETVYLESEKNQLQSKKLSDETVLALRKQRDNAREYEQFQAWQANARKKSKTVEKKMLKEQKKAKTIRTTGLILAVISFIIGLMVEENLFLMASFLLVILSVSQWFLFKNNWKKVEELSSVPESNAKQSALSDEELFEIEQRLSIDETIGKELDVIEAERKKHHVQLLKLDEKSRLFQDRLYRFEQQIEEQIDFYPFLEPFDVHYWPEYFQRLQSFLEKKQQADEIKKQLDSLTKEQAFRKEEIDQIIDQFEPTALEKNAAERLVIVKNALADHTNQHSRFQEEKSELVNVQLELEVIAEEMQVYEREKAELFTMANVTTEEAFYEVATNKRAQENWLHALEETKKQLIAIFPHDNWQSITERQVSKVEIDQQIVAFEEQLVEEKETESSLRDEFAKVQAERNQLESQDIYSDRLHQLEIEKEKLHELAKEWILLKIEREMLQETKQQYREKYLTQIMEETAAYFERITNGAYIRVYAPIAEETFLVVSKDDVRYNVQELSQGTIHQLYVALRLAINKVMATNYQLPFIIDDAFLHFDVPRTERMVRLLVELANEQQVILFTYRKEIVQMSERLNLSVKQL